MTKVKICGLKRIEDVKYVNELKPDYVGFVFAGSKRKITPELAKTLAEALDKNIETVGVFVNETVEDIKKIADYVGLDILQLHGDEDIEYIKQLEGYRVWKAIRVENFESLKEAGMYPVEGVLLDSSFDGMYGGSGTTFNWNDARGIGGKTNIILAGGLSVDNVEKGIEIVNPQVVDISSGVETDGFKDYDKIKKFIEKVRSL